MFKYTKTYTVEPDGYYCGDCKFFSEHEYKNNGCYCELFNVSWYAKENGVFYRKPECIINR